MYSPAPFSTSKRPAALEFIARHPFATMISMGLAEPLITHVPLILQADSDDSPILLGHLARANPHWRHWQSGESLAVFHGPHGYISPQWYAEADVPTWNYSVAHVHGPIELIEDSAGIMDCLRLLVEHAEKLWPSGWSFNVPAEYTPQNIGKMIVGFRLKVRDIQYKQKLSQNRSHQDQLSVLTHLRQRGDHGSQLLADEMLRFTQS